MREGQFRSVGGRLWVVVDMVCSIVVMVCKNKKIVLNEIIKETELEAEKIKWSDTIRKAME